ncbi:alpha/beta fold hydrolase [Crystallibacter crystallopoietes]|nr:alpha/beta hydrolase [Arthrobacter crystallopoietes]
MVEINGCELKVATRGSGVNTYVLIPGIGVSPRYFQPLADVLATVGIVHEVELPGFGSTKAPRRRVPIHEFGLLVRQALAEAGAGPAVLVGHSMGCQIAAEMTAAVPALTKGLVLLGPTVNCAERGALLQGFRLLQDTLREPPRVNAIVFSDYVRSGPRWYLRTLPEMLRHRVEDVLARIDVPTIILRGERDPIVPRSWVQTLAAASPAVRIADIAGEAHVLMYRRPRTVAAYCEEVAARG